MKYYVYDPDPISEWYPNGGPILVKFDTKEEAETYANESHPEDMSGNTQILPVREFIDKGNQA